MWLEKVQPIYFTFCTRGTCGALTQMYSGSDANFERGNWFDYWSNLLYKSIFLDTATAGQTSTFDVCVATIRTTQSARITPLIRLHN